MIDKFQPQLEEMDRFLATRIGDAIILLGCALKSSEEEEFLDHIESAADILDGILDMHEDEDDPTPEPSMN